MLVFSCVRIDLFLYTGKIEARKMKENVVDGQRGSVTADGIEDFCETFERTVKPVVVSISLLSTISRFVTGKHWTC